jgi:isoleucyl-tRNA synthetase
VVVTQPFNLQIQFGLSFLRVFSFMEAETTDTKISSDSFAEWKKMRYQINNSMRYVLIISRFYFCGLTLFSFVGGN